MPQKAIMPVQDYVTFTTTAGPICPHCLGKRFSTLGKLRMQNQYKYFRQCLCKACGAKWEEQFELSGYTNLMAANGQQMIIPPVPTPGVTPLKSYGQVFSIPSAPIESEVDAELEALLGMDEAVTEAPTPRPNLAKLGGRMVECSEAGNLTKQKLCKYYETSPSGAKCTFERFDCFCDNVDAQGR